MTLNELVTQVKEELRNTERYDMRTFDFIHFEHDHGAGYDTVEFYIYELPSLANRSYVTLTYDLTSGKRLFKMTQNQGQPKAKKKVAGFERKGKIYLFTKENPEHKVFARLLAGEMTKLKDFPEDVALQSYKTNKLLEEINTVEKRTLMLVKDNFEDLRDFVHHNI